MNKTTNLLSWILVLLLAVFPLIPKDEIYSRGIETAVNRAGLTTEEVDILSYSKTELPLWLKMEIDYKSKSSQESFKTSVVKFAFLDYQVVGFQVL